MSQSEIKLGIAWYSEEQWELLKSTASDPEIIEDTHQEWLVNAKKRMKELKKEGFDTVEVDFDVNQFNEWCQINNKPRNGENRASFTSQLLRIKSEGNR